MDGKIKALLRFDRMNGTAFGREKNTGLIRVFFEDKPPAIRKFAVTVYKIKNFQPQKFRDSIFFPFLS